MNDQMSRDGPVFKRVGWLGCSGPSSLILFEKISVLRVLMKFHSKIVGTSYF